MVGLKKKHDLVKTEKASTKKAKKSKSAKDKAGASSQSLAAWSFQPAAIALLVIVALAVALEIVFVTSVENGQQQDVNARYAELVQRDLNFLANERLGALKSVARSPELIERLITSAENNHDLLRATFPDLVEFYVVSAEQLPQVRTLYPNLGYASVDAIRKAQTLENLKLEAFYDGSKWFYQAALAVTDEPAAVILFLFDDSEIKRALQGQAKALEGNIALYSSSAENAAKVMEFGSPAHGEQLSKPIHIGSWQLRYATTANGLIAVDRTFLWSILAAAALISLILVYLICRLRLNKIRSDVVLTSSLVLSGISGERKSSVRLAFAETSSLLENANKALAEQEQKAKPAMAAKPNASNAAESMGVVEAHAEDSSDDDLNFDDLDLDEELGLNEPEVALPRSDEHEGAEIDASIFRAYDIRGIVDETLTLETVELIGRSLASEALSQGQNTLCVGYDGRLSSEAYCRAICQGITSTGADAIVVGRVPTPVLYFATHKLETGTGVMITGSHNPSNYNGFKMMIGGKTLAGDDIQTLYQRIRNGDFASGSGSVSEQSVDDIYLDTIVNDVAVAAPLRVVVDAGNGVAGELGPKLIEELGCEVIPLFCDIDGTFPNHHPDPGKPKNLEDLIAAVEEHDADVGLAFDGDGDRVGVVTNTGKIIWPDRLLMLFAKDVVSRNPGADIIYDVKCSRRLNGLISSYGGRPIMWKTGHSLIKAKMKETGALLAGEMSGHIFFKERWFGFDDGLYSAVRLLELLGIEDRSAEEVFADFPEDLSTPEINITVSDESKFELIEKLCARAAAFEDGNVSTIDGLRVDFADGWGLCRASNTTPVLVLRFEADDEAALKRIQQRFKDQLLAIDESLNVAF
ncbi:hypothetical protein A3742_04555 [Oleiphilus sp. HI0071]|uniref:phosphomannomutase/phosphoglucomutase n=1 Tax=unclassified Oleiphilus TaxID=2631174 RepID=UPI0007C2DBA7|nr:hypothetical protein A3737_03535 [Oleiphilus sp. HI0065]KZY86455.1 hypothetical protein A3742_04555 [Oleiphilus sp. HI0071]KZY90472.1 hypothetical protein A3744_15495 [Oleiphilus sp. HI0073]KZZ14769.1 hypothetical protein A3750_13530 [Oleiphilus sp. HI0079]KZZ17255.1 hypothetical protein A3751_12285 [Oleiphilus sp. HI0080]KZZ51430.1 hypothetical protein A3760_12990 [Oleiphilus sp. HI0122]KZZ51497.1 hypothetical protein A3758_11810 [Oleiphilus sp. HI0118]KZZ74038.1 hypothetical protein A37